MALRFVVLAGACAAAAAGGCEGAGCAAVGAGDDLESLHLLQTAVAGARQLAETQAAPKGLCEVQANVACPGAEGGAMCMGDQCCPGTAASGDKTFACPSASLGFAGCETKWRGESCVPCLCSFDIDRTLTGKQGDLGSCPQNRELNHTDTAYGGGKLTLSEVGQSFADSFCSGCYVAIVTAGDASGPDSKERQTLAEHVGSNGRLLSTQWVGPSVNGENRRSCEGVPITSQLVVGCNDGTKQFAVQGVVDWLKSEHGVEIPKDHVWHFDDRLNNIEPFEGTGFNARQISCQPRDGGADGIGHCGATVAELLPDVGVATCP